MKLLRVGVIALAMTAVWAAQAFSAEATKEPSTIKLPGGAEIQVLRDLSYVENGHERNRLDLYLPAKADKASPLVLWIHGGGWLAGDKKPCLMAWLTLKGYAVASMNYRFSNHAVFPAQIHDCKAAVRWLRANAKKYHLDAEHIGACGASAGGHLVSLLGTTANVKELEGSGGNPDQSTRVQAVIDFCGPSDLTLPVPKPAVKAMVTGLLGGPAAENAEKARAASPITYVGKDAAPFIIMHGDKDEIVPPEHAQKLADALKAAGVEVHLDIVAGGGHGGPQFATPARMKLIEEFLDKHLKETKTSDKKASGT
jgi:acetyl esterase/lipase